MKFILLCTLIIDLAHAIPYENTRGFTSVKHKRQISNSSISVHVVDLGYEIYEGYTNTSTGLNVWKGCVQQWTSTLCYCPADEASAFATLLLRPGQTGGSLHRLLLSTEPTFSPLETSLQGVPKQPMLLTLATLVRASRMS